MPSTKHSEVWGLTQLLFHCAETNKYILFDSRDIMMDKSEEEKRGFREWEEGLLPFSMSHLRKLLWFRDLGCLFCLFGFFVVVCLLLYVTL